MISLGKHFWAAVLKTFIATLLFNSKEEEEEEEEEEIKMIDK